MKKPMCPRCEKHPFRPGRPCPGCGLEVEIGLKLADEYLLGAPMPTVTERPSRECPCCPHGVINPQTQTCDKCGIAIANGARVTHTAGRRSRGRGPDHDRVGAFTDFARYKEDHREGE